MLPTTHAATPTERPASSNYSLTRLQFKIAILPSKKTLPSSVPTSARPKPFLRCANTTSVSTCVKKLWRKTTRLVARTLGRLGHSKRRRSRHNLLHARVRRKSRRWSAFRRILKLCRFSKIRSCKAFCSKLRVIRKRCKSI